MSWERNAREKEARQAIFALFLAAVLHCVITLAMGTFRESNAQAESNHDLELGKHPIAKAGLPKALCFPYAEPDPRDYSLDNGKYSWRPVLKAINSARTTAWEKLAPKKIEEMKSDRELLEWAFYYHSGFPGGPNSVGQGIQKQIDEEIAARAEKKGSILAHLVPNYFSKEKGIDWLAVFHSGMTHYKGNALVPVLHGILPFPLMFKLPFAHSYWYGGMEHRYPATQSPGLAADAWARYAKQYKEGDPPDFSDPALSPFGNYLSPLQAEIGRQALLSQMEEYSVNAWYPKASWQARREESLSATREEQTRLCPATPEKSKLAEQVGRVSHLVYLQQSSGLPASVRNVLYQHPDWLEALDRMASEAKTPDSRNEVYSLIRDHLGKVVGADAATKVAAIEETNEWLLRTLAGFPSVKASSDPQLLKLVDGILKSQSARPSPEIPIEKLTGSSELSDSLKQKYGKAEKNSTKLALQHLMNHLEKWKSAKGEALSPSEIQKAFYQKNDAVPQMKSLPSTKLSDLAKLEEKLAQHEGRPENYKVVESAPKTILLAPPAKADQATYQPPSQNLFPKTITEKEVSKVHLAPEKLDHFRAMEKDLLPFWPTLLEHLGLQKASYQYAAQPYYHTLTGTYQQSMAGCLKAGMLLPTVEEVGKMWPFLAAAHPPESLSHSKSQGTYDLAPPGACLWTRDAEKSDSRLKLWVEPDPKAGKRWVASRVSASDLAKLKTKSCGTLCVEYGETKQAELLEPFEKAAQTLKVALETAEVNGYPALNYQAKKLSSYGKDFLEGGVLAYTKENEKSLSYLDASAAALLAGEKFAGNHESLLKKKNAPPPLLKTMATVAHYRLMDELAKIQNELKYVVPERGAWVNGKYEGWDEDLVKFKQVSSKLTEKHWDALLNHLGIEGARFRPIRVKLGENGWNGTFKGSYSHALARCLKAGETLATSTELAKMYDFLVADNDRAKTVDPLCSDCDKSNWNLLKGPDRCVWARDSAPGKIDDKLYLTPDWGNFKIGKRYAVKASKGGVDKECSALCVSYRSPKHHLVKGFLDGAYAAIKEKLLKTHYNSWSIISHGGLNGDAKKLIEKMGDQYSDYFAAHPPPAHGRADMYAVDLSLQFYFHDEREKLLRVKAEDEARVFQKGPPQSEAEAAYENVSHRFDAFSTLFKYGWDNNSPGDMAYAMAWGIFSPGNLMDQAVLGTRILGGSPKNLVKGFKGVGLAAKEILSLNPPPSLASQLPANLGPPSLAQINPPYVRPPSGFPTVNNGPLNLSPGGPSGNPVSPTTSNLGSGPGGANAGSPFSGGLTPNAGGGQQFQGGGGGPATAVLPPPSQPAGLTPPRPGSAPGVTGEPVIPPGPAMALVPKNQPGVPVPLTSNEPFISAPQPVTMPPALPFEGGKLAGFQKLFGKQFELQLPQKAGHVEPANGAIASASQIPAPIPIAVAKAGPQPIPAPEPWPTPVPSPQPAQTRPDQANPDEVCRPGGPGDVNSPTAAPPHPPGPIPFDSMACRISLAVYRAIQIAKPIAQARLALLRTLLGQSTTASLLHEQAILPQAIAFLNRETALGAFRRANGRYLVAFSGAPPANPVERDARNWAIGLLQSIVRPQFPVGMIDFVPGDYDPGVVGQMRPPIGATVRDSCALARASVYARTGPAPSSVQAGVELWIPGQGSAGVLNRYATQPLGFMFSCPSCRCNHQYLRNGFHPPGINSARCLQPPAPLPPGN